MAGKRKDSVTGPAWLTRGATRRPEKYLLRLFLTGTTPASVRALVNTKQVCEQHLAGRYDLEVIDIYQQPDRASGEQVVVAPTLVKEHPLPVRRLIGDMSNAARVLQGLGLDSRVCTRPCGSRSMRRRARWPWTWTGRSTSA